MNLEIREYLNPKIEHHCLCLFENGHYPECAHTAMKQVELNLNKKLGIVGYEPTTKTIWDKFSQRKGICLKVPFGEEQQENAKLLFQGAFKYYRNYSAHQDTNIVKETSLRIMLIASELLDLLDVCYLSIDELGGIEEIKRVLEIKNDERLEELLTFIDGQWIADDSCDGFFEDLYKKGFGTDHYDKLFELNLVSYQWGPCESSENELDPPEEIGFFGLTALGNEVVETIRKKRA
ncbi:MAG: hypothetical protein NTX71_12415 [Candidatus Aureabacteria bacterium]|nr:hypothetical protein [Candidatus Auribacterota bacterium]